MMESYYVRPLFLGKFFSLKWFKWYSPFLYVETYKISSTCLKLHDLLNYLHKSHNY